MILCSSYCLRATRVSETRHLVSLQDATAHFSLHDVVIGGNVAPFQVTFP